MSITTYLFSKSSILILHRRIHNIGIVKFNAMFQISHFKVPRHIEFVQDFPKTTSGKIRKFMLKEAMEKRLNV
jgi:Acyl-CoA synthetases (AMP-forming)/AMP-acid ligases II